MKYFLLFICSFFSHSAICCLNEYRALIDGTITFADNFNAVPSARFTEKNKKNLQAQINLHYEMFQLKGRVEDYSDYAVLLVYKGEYNKAKSIFQDIERKSPGYYTTAANLGTTYELLGMNDSALYWIKKAIAINPKSHNGSEWIHVKILEAKIRAGNDVNYFLSNHILDLDFGEGKMPVFNKQSDLNKLRKQLYFQLSERMSFIKPKDPVMGQLLFDLGNITAVTMDVKSGIDVYKLAKTYGYNSSVLEKRESHFKSLQRKADLLQWLSDHPGLVLIIVGVLLALLISVLVYFIRKLIRKKRIT